MAAQNVIVWEFEGDLPGLFAPFDCKVSNWIEKKYEKNPSEQNVNLGNVDHLLGHYEIDFVQMVQKNLEVQRRTRKVRRQHYSTMTVIGSGVIWQWMTEQGWVVYDKESIEAIERCFNQNKEECDLQTLQHGLPNVVLVNKDYQRNKTSGFVRPVRRTTANYKQDATIGMNSVRKRIGPSIPTQMPNLLMPNARPKPAQISMLNKAAARMAPAASASTYGHAIPSSNAAAAAPTYWLTATHSNASTAAAVNNSGVVKVRKKTKKQLPSNHVLHQFCVIASNVTDGKSGSNDEKDCAICLGSLFEEQASTLPEAVLELKICKHQFHESCLDAMYKQSHNQNKCLRCPICKQIHGTLMGDQPRGRMTYRIDPTQSVDGYPGEGVIVITYEIYPGVQGPEHPNPGRGYILNGFPRVAYLPANTKGRMCLQLLEVAFNRRLTFTVGTSSTSGADNCVTWTTIHHKTTTHGNSNGHGFPDPGYLDNLMEELKNLGVTKDDLKF